MKKTNLLVLMVALSPGSINPAGAATVTYVSDPSALTWYKGRTADTVTPGTGSVLFTEGQASGSHFLTNLPTISLAEGDTLVLNLGFTLGTLGATGNSLRFGLYNSGASQVAANFNSTTNSAFSDDYGYLVNQNLDGGSPNLFTRSTTATTALLGSTNSTGYTTISTTNSGTLGAFASSTAYTMVLTLVKLSNGFEVTSVWNGGVNSNVTRSGTDSSGNSAVLSSFNEFAFYVNAGTAALDTVNVTSLTIAVTSVPEPSNHAMMAGAVMLGFMVLRRRWQA